MTVTMPTRHVPHRRAHKASGASPVAPGLRLSVRRPRKVPAVCGGQGLQRLCPGSLYSGPRPGAFRCALAVELPLSMEAQRHSPQRRVTGLWLDRPRARAAPWSLRGSGQTDAALCGCQGAGPSPWEGGVGVRSGPLGSEGQAGRSSWPAPVSGCGLWVREMGTCSHSATDELCQVTPLCGHYL